MTTKQATRQQPLLGNSFVNSNDTGAIAGQQAHAIKEKLLMAVLSA
jgi:hypothetical protein